MRPVSWMSYGACREADPELFFPIAAGGPAAQQVEAAKAVCSPCAVRANCLSYAQEAKAEGIWGGTTLEERHAAQSRRARQRAAMTGEGATPAGQAFPPGRTA
jgi:WhiB family transcriptional regulator, redox-sensing transcriptional regulator